MEHLLKDFQVAAIGRRRGGLGRAVEAGGVGGVGVRLEQARGVFAGPKGF